MQDGLWSVGVESLYLPGSGGVLCCAEGLQQPFPRLELAYAPGWCPARLPELEPSPLELQRRPIRCPSLLCKTNPSLFLAFRLRQGHGLETFYIQLQSSFPVALTSTSYG